MSEQESEPGGPQYGGDRGGGSGGSDGGQGGAGRESGEKGEKHRNEQGGQSGGVAGRGPTERAGEPTTGPTTNDSDASPTQSGVDRAQEKQREMEESGEELPG